MQDTEPPVITCPANITISNDPGECGAFVTFPDPTVTDNCPVTVSCSPASGSFFPVGTTTVTCTATDAAGNTSTCSFTVTVQDTEAPVITCPADVTVPNDPGENGAIVTYPNPTVTDNCPGPIDVSCSPASGSFFPIGTSTVTCTATDAAGNTATCSFTVTVERSGADLSVTTTDFPDPVRVGQILTYTVIIQNRGPFAASNVTLTDRLPNSVQFISATVNEDSANVTSATSDQVNILQSNRVLTFQLGTLDASSTVSVTIRVSPQIPGFITNRATVRSSTFDPDPNNNTSIITTRVLPSQK
ncbi:HYR domain-containing protein [Polycladomyces subterraneus]|uniref:HYR domain-containing protein n=1 Tax=Polycladomyces subterraneus TaxID=1016997 RepID=A0ABT8IP20_9BACL|nr:HYR domain-containing protein [Polycladomyces subterraneus]MDN4594492.1 HYR domain-containing protein [Polycladomyces subterraneus]